MSATVQQHRNDGGPITAPAALFRYRVPPRPIADFVALFWYWRGHSLPRATERVLPMGTMELVIRLGAGNAADGGISGPHSEAFLIERTTQDELLGIHFKPGGAFPFLGCPAGDLHNRYATLADLWGETNARALAGMLHEAPDVNAKFRVLERWLERIAVRPLVHHPAVSFAMQTFEQDATPSARRTAEAAGLSQRRFIEVFREQVGLTPKLYCRIRRFQRILNRIGGAQEVDWTDVALSCGYFDQPHFIHDFREFTGLRPSEYLQLRIAGHQNHVQVRE